MASADGSSRRTSELPYDLLDDRYRLESLIGRGGMAAVYRGTDTRLDRPVAIKMLADAPAADDQRFRVEVRTLARFSHPNLVRLLDAGEVDGRLYLVMDYIKGTTLAERVRTGRLPESEVAAIGAGVAAALAYVHKEGIVHRDIKPANILLDDRGVAYLADFGIARLVDTTRMTATGLVLGTPAYLAPEQLQGDDVGAAADVFALGLVLIECLSGDRAFTGTLSEVAANRTLRDPEIPADLDGRWATLLRSMTARDPALRVTASSAALQLSGWRGRSTNHGGAGSIFGAGGPTAAVLTDPAYGATEQVGTSDPTLAATRVADFDVHRSHGPTLASAWQSRKGRTLIAAAALIVALLLGLALGGALFVSGPTRSLSSDRRLHTSAVSHSTKHRSPPTSTTTTTTPVQVPSVATAAGGLMTNLAAGAASGNVSPQTGQQLVNQLEALVFSSSSGTSNQHDEQVQQFDQLAQTLDQDVTNGEITGSSTVSSLTSSIDALSAALGTSVPAPTTAAPPAPPVGPTSAGNQGKGKGKGKGNH